MNVNGHNEGDPGPRLEAGLRGLYGRSGGVPAGLDEAVLRLAAERAGIVRRKRALGRFLGRAAAVAAAAGLALAAVIIPRLGTRPSTPMAAAPAVAGDINADGTVDILDALALAMRLEAAAGELPRAWDLSGDGVVDRADVETIAQRIVRLEGRG